MHLVLDSDNEIKKIMLKYRTNYICNYNNDVCHCSVERLFYQLCKSGHPTLDPLVLTPDEIITFREDKITQPQSLASLLNGHR